MKNKLAITLIAVVLVGVAAYFVISLFYNFTEEPPSVKTVFIPRNAPVIQAANILEANGVIKSAAKFKILASILGKSQSIKPGEYEFNLPDHPINILKRITLGKIKTHKFTIPEGVTAREIGIYLEREGLGNGKKFADLIYENDLLEKYRIESPTLEGYLFPETYILDKLMSEKTIIEIMLRRFFAEVRPELIREGTRIGMKLNSLVTLASMIEKETGVDAERPIISSVFHNRLKKGMRLQCDPTVIYGIKNFDGNLTKLHLSTKTPYNTYMIKGLPLGPISNPGLSSIRAALSPANTDYLFFVSRNDGSHVFTSTYQEHLKNVNQFQLKGKGKLVSNRSSKVTGH